MHTVEFVYNLSSINKSTQVAWLRVDTQTILTIQHHVITKNHRIGIAHTGNQVWLLHIRDVKEADQGWYMVNNRIYEIEVSSELSEFLSSHMYNF